MVTELHKNSKKFYICDACGFAYEQKELAQKYQRWCEEHNSCNLELTKYAVPLETDERRFIEPAKLSVQIRLVGC